MAAANEEESLERCGQSHVTCDICEIAPYVEFRCNDCEFYMCKKCKEKVHPKFAVRHEVVPVKMKPADHDETGNELDVLNFTMLRCHEHKNAQGCLFCRTCNELICAPCVAGKHKNHDFVETKTGYEMKVEAIHKYEKKMNEDKERIMDRIKELKNEKSSKEEQYIQVREQIKTNETKLKDKVEANSTKMSGLLTKVWDEVAEDIEEELWLNNRKLNEVEAKIRKSLSMCDLKDTCEFFQQVEENEKMFQEDNEVVKIMMQSQYQHFLVEI